jgi:beta-lactamase superfamily II metal-dependent hydrolase
LDSELHPIPLIRIRMRMRSLLLALVALIPPALAGDGSAHVYWIDSEGGGSTLIVTPAGESVLIDSGNAGGRDPGRIHKVAEAAGLRQIDHYITTHFHSDHMGGIPELSTRIPIVHVWDNGLPDTDPDGNKSSAWPLTSKAYRTMEVRERQVVKPGTEIPLKTLTGPAVRLQCVIARQEVWPSPTWGKRTIKLPGSVPPSKPVDTSDNANSSAWIFSFGGFRLYDGGDLTWNTEAKLIVPEVLVPEVDVYQVTHHGLDVSNHPWLIASLRPTVSVMNNGSTKGTAGEVIQTLRAQPRLYAQYQVHKNVRPDSATNNCPDDHIANLDPNCDGNYIHCRITPDAVKYYIEIPAKHHSATFITRAK